VVTNYLPVLFWVHCGRMEVMVFESLISSNQDLASAFQPMYLQKINTLLGTNISPRKKLF